MDVRYVVLSAVETAGHGDRNDGRAPVRRDLSLNARVVEAECSGHDVSAEGADIAGKRLDYLPEPGVIDGRRIGADYHDFGNLLRTAQFFDRLHRPFGLRISQELELGGSAVCKQRADGHCGAHEHDQPDEHDALRVQGASAR